MTDDSRIEDLQAVSQQVLISTERIQQLESEKRAIDPGSPRFEELSNEIERLADEIRMTSHAETGMAREVKGEPGLPTVEEADGRSER